MTNEPPPVPALTIDYADARDTLRPMSLTAARWIFGLAAVPSIVGLTILLGFRLTGSNQLPGFGFLWLIGGGIMTFVMGVIALVNAIRAVSRRPREGHVAWWYLRAIVVCFINLGVAYICARFGEEWMDTPHFRMTVKNDTATPIDGVVVHFKSGDVSVGPIAPHQTRQSGLVWVRHVHAPLDITTTVQGRSRRKTDRADLNLFVGQGAQTSFEVTVEPAELPKGTP